MLQLGASSARTRRKGPARLTALLGLPFLLVLAVAMSVSGGGAASAAAACQAVASGPGSTVPIGTGGGGSGAVGQITPLQVEQYWVGAGGPMSGAVTAAAIASAESDDITDRLQGSSPSTPTTPTGNTPSDPALVGWGLWQITPGSAADYDPTVNAKIAVEKYQGSLAAGGGGWSPWTTYTSGAYTSGIPAAQAAYAQLTAQGGGVSPGATAKATSAALTATVATAAPATASPTTGTAPAQLDTSSADQYITRLTGQNDAQYAIVEANGTVLAQHEDGTAVAAGQATYAMLLLAYLRAHPSSDPSGGAAAHLQAMIENSNGSAASWVYGQVGAAAVAQIASLAHMSGFHLNGSPGAHALARSTVTAEDLALLLANIDMLMPAPVRTYGMGLLAHVPHTSRWGLLAAGISTVNASAGGAVAGTDGKWTLGQAAQVSTSQHGVIGVAVTSTENASQSNGQNVVQNVGSDLLANPNTDTSGYSIDTSGLSPSQQAELSNLAANMQSSGQSSQCPNVSVSGSLPTVPGQLATIDAATGVAAAPTGLPPNVGAVIDKLIAAGNEIHTKPYLAYHWPSLATMWPAYDCSGSTSYILYKAGLLGPSPYVSGMFDHWGQPGPGKYVTVFYNADHVFIEVDGIVFNTAHYATTEPAGTGPRWQPSSTIQPQINGDVSAGHGGFAEAHPPGL
jgi:hypothetical protein